MSSLEGPELSVSEAGGTIKGWGNGGDDFHATQYINLHSCNIVPFSCSVGEVPPGAHVCTMGGN